VAAINLPAACGLPGTSCCDGHSPDEVQQPGRCPGAGSLSQIQDTVESSVLELWCHDSRQGRGAREVACVL